MGSAATIRRDGPWLQCEDQVPRRIVCQAPLPDSRKLVALIYQDGVLRPAPASRYEPATLLLALLWPKRGATWHYQVLASTTVRAMTAGK